MSRVLQLEMRGEDVALLQTDLNVWYGYWGAPPSQLLDRDGDFGPNTERAFRRVRHRLGLPKREADGATAVTPRDRLVVRHLGRFLVAKRAGKTYVVPATAQRTPEEIARGKTTRDWERKLR